MRIFVQDHLSGAAFRRRRKICEKNNYRYRYNIPKLFFEPNPGKIGSASLNRLRIQRDKNFTGLVQRLVRLWRIGQKDHLWTDFIKYLLY